MNNLVTTGFDDESFEAITKDRLVRQAVARDSHAMFFHLYFPHYVRYPIAEFQKDIFRITEDQSNKLACIVAFRGSGKSTLVTFSYSLWATLGIQQKKFVLIICQTQAQARQHMANLKYELEQNRLLKSDLGPFREDAGTGEWAISSLVFQNTGARIMIASVDQSIRGIRHHEHRPDLLILDDIEDMQSARTYDSRTDLFAADTFVRATHTLERGGHTIGSARSCIRLPRPSIRDSFCKRSLLQLFKFTKQKSNSKGEEFLRKVCGSQQNLGIVGTRR